MKTFREVEKSPSPKLGKCPLLIWEAISILASGAVLGTQVIFHFLSCVPVAGDVIVWQQEGGD